MKVSLSISLAARGQRLCSRVTKQIWPNSTLRKMQADEQSLVNFPPNSLHKPPDISSLIHAGCPLGKSRSFSVITANSVAFAGS
jgi:hypothetical protein